MACLTRLKPCERSGCQLTPPASLLHVTFNQLLSPEIGVIKHHIIAGFRNTQGSIMAGKPLVGVIGATGMQGGSVVKFLLASGRFRIRGICRNTAAAAANAQAVQGVEMVSADMENVETVKQALKGCDFVFGVTNFWEHWDEGETRQGKNLIDAAKAEGVRHFVYSTMGMSYSWGKREGPPDTSQSILEIERSGISIPRLGSTII